MFFHQIIQALHRVEAIQQEILDRLPNPAGNPPRPVDEHQTAAPAPGTDEWMQRGIHNILAYDAGKKQED